MTISRPYINFRTKQYVYSKDETMPYVGFEHLSESPNGWEYNIKRWCGLFDLRLPSLPRLGDSSIQGVSESEYFLSGVGSKVSGDLNIERLEEVFNENSRIWAPVINNGTYFRFRTKFFLYSDNSRIQYVDPNLNKNGKNFVELDAELDMNSPILAASFKRHPKTNTPYYSTVINQVSRFSGTYINEVEKETSTSTGTVIWENINTNKKEFIVDNSIEGKTFLRFNKDYIKTHGIVPVEYQDLAACEVVGRSNGKDYQAYYLEHFPVLLDDTFHLYLVNNFSWEELERVNTWFELINIETYPTKNKFYLDKDLGIIYFGASSRSGIPSLGTFLVASYKSTIRIEYEEENKTHTLIASTADVNPLSQSINQGFVCITHDQLEAATIKLKIDKQRIPFTVNPVEYGPMYIGSDYALLKATVESTEGNPIPHMEVSFTMTPFGLGGLNGSDKAVSVTNGRGEAFTSYQPPVSGEDMGFYSITVRPSTHPLYPTGYKELILNIRRSGLEGKEPLVYLYQVLKDDLMIAYDSLDNFLYTIDTPAWVVDATTYARWKTEFSIENNIKDWYDSSLYNSKTEEFSKTGTLRGRKVVVYKTDSVTDNYDSTAINPITGKIGAIVPVRPELVEVITDEVDAYYGKCRLIFPEGSLPDPDPDDPANNIGGYWVIASKLVEFQAHCFSSYYNKILYSNKLVVRLSLPKYMLGEYINDMLQKIPFGWKLPMDTDNIASGLDGATFITINPHAKPYPDNNVLWGPYNILDLVNGTVADDWADAPFNSVGFQFNIEE